MIRGSLVVLILAASTPVMAQTGNPEQEASKHGWLPSLEEGKAQARKTGKPLFVVLRCAP